MFRAKLKEKSDKKEGYEAFEVSKKPKSQKALYSGKNKN